MIPILKRIGAGVLKGFPLVNTIKEIVKPSSITNSDAEKPKNDYVKIISELIVVILICAFVSGKITMEDLMKLLTFF